MGTLLTERNVTAKWKQNTTRGQNSNSFFCLLKQCSELMCKGCRKSKGGNLMARNSCRKIPQKYLMPFLSIVSFLLFDSNSYKFMCNRNNFLRPKIIILMSFLFLTATKKKKRNNLSAFVDAQIHNTESKSHSNKNCHMHWTTAGLCIFP